MLHDKGTKNFGYYLDRTVRQVKLDLIRGFKQVGISITPEQWVILSRLYDENGLSQKDLADNSYKNAPTVSRIIDLLCEKGLTKRLRFDGDRRRYKIFLTAQGKEVVEKAIPVVLSTRTKGWKGLSDEDYTTLIRIVDTIFENINNSG